MSADQVVKLLRSGFGTIQRLATAPVEQRQLGSLLNVLDLHLRPAGVGGEGQRRLVHHNVASQPVDLKGCAHAGDEVEQVIAEVDRRQELPGGHDALSLPLLLVLPTGDESLRVALEGDPPPYYLGPVTWVT